MPIAAKKYLDASGVSYLASLLDNYPNNEILSTVIDAIQDALDEKQNNYITRTITLTTNGWVNKTQTVTANSVTSDTLVQVSPAPASVLAYAENKIICTAQSTNTLTFTCDTIPSTALTVNIVIWS